MGYRERQRRERETIPDATPGEALSLVGQLLWQGVREEKQKWYGLLILLPRFYLTLRFSRRLRQISARVEAAQQRGGPEAEAARQESTEEVMALLVEKKLVKPAIKPK